MTLRQFKLLLTVRIEASLKNNEALILPINHCFIVENCKKNRED